MHRHIFKPSQLIVFKRQFMIQNMKEVLNWLKLYFNQENSLLLIKNTNFTCYTIKVYWQYTFRSKILYLFLKYIFLIE